MKQKLRKIISLMLVLALVASFAPVTALADGGEEDSTDDGVLYGETQPTAEATAEPLEEATEEPTEETAEEPMEETAEEPTEESAEEAEEETGEESTEESAEESSEEWTELEDLGELVPADEEIISINPEEPLDPMVAAEPGTLQWQINEIEETGTVTLDKDYTENIIIPDGKIITLDLNGHTLNATRPEGDTNTLNAVTVYGGLTLLGGTLSSGGVSDVRGVTVGSGGSFTLLGGTITGFNVVGNGAGVRVENYGSFSMLGGTITANTASEYGGGVFVFDAENASLTGGSITGNTAEYGGGVAFNLMDPAYTLSGVGISGNNATNGGGVYVDSGAALNLENISINGNSAVNNGGGLYINGGVGMTMNDGANLTGNSAARGGGAYFAMASTVTLSANIELSYNSASLSGGGLWMYRGGILNVNGTTIHDNYSGQNGGGVTIDSANTNGQRGTLNMTGATVTRNSVSETASDANGAGIYVSSGGVVSITDCEFYDNHHARYGSGLFVNTYSNVKLINSKFYQNSVRAVNGGSGGGAFVGDNSTVTITGCEVYENDYETNDVGGSGFRIGGTVTISDTTIHHNRSSSTGGGAQFNGTLNVVGDLTVTDNYGGSGGGFYVSTLNMKGGTLTVTNNNGYSGGGIYVNSAFNTVDGGTVVVTGNQSRESGGGIYGWTLNLNLDDLLVAENTAASSGGGIFCRKLSMSAGTVTKNACSGSGGGIAIGDNATVSEISGGEITNNTGGSGGGVYHQNWGTLTVSGGRIAGNTASSNGGGFYADNATRLYITGGEITDNTANSGGGIYAVNKELAITGGAIYSNLARVAGRDVYCSSAWRNNRSYSRVRFSICEAADMACAGEDSAWLDELTGEYLTEAFNNFEEQERLQEEDWREENPVHGSAPHYYTFIYGRTEVAQIGDVTYDTLQAAFDAIESDPEIGTDILLLRDTTEDITVRSGVTAVLDLDGHKVIGLENSTFLVERGADLTVMDTSEDESGAISGGKGTLHGYLQNDSTVVDYRYGAGVYVAGRFTLESGSIRDNRLASGGYGTAVYISDGASFTMNGGTILNNTCASGDNVAVRLHIVREVLEDAPGTGASFTINGGTIRYSSYLIFSNDPNDRITINGGQLTANSTVSSGPVRVEGGTLVMTGGEISGNRANNYGGGIYATNGANVTISGGKITGNRVLQANSNGVGSGVCFTGNTLTITGGEISGNSTSNYGRGGGVYFGGTGDLIITGGTISGNSTGQNGYGGGVFIAGGQNFVFTGGVITGNHASYGGGICDLAYGQARYSYASNPGLSYTDEAKIYENTADVSGGDIYFGFVANNNASQQNGVRVLAFLDAADMGLGYDCWHDDQSNTDITEVAETLLTRRDSGGNTYILTAGYGLTASNKAEETDAARIGETVYSRLADAIDAAESGDTIHLLKDLTESVTIPAKELTINLNGYTLSGTGGNIFTVKGGQLTVKADDGQDDAKPDGVGTLRSQEQQKTARAVYLTSAGSSFAMEGGVIDGFSGTGYGGAAYLLGNTSASFTGVSISDCSANYGGGVFLSSSSVCQFTDCVFTDCAASAYGGALYVSGGAEATVNGGSISNCSAVTYGGAVYTGANNSKLSMTDVDISSCTATYGGAVYASQTNASTELSLQDCSFTGNSATTGHGGAVYFYYNAISGYIAKLTVDGCVFKDNFTNAATNAQYGGALYIDTRSTGSHQVSITNSEFEGNKARQGGAIYLVAGQSGANDRTTVLFQGLTISGNSATDSYGGCYIGGHKSLTVDNVTITDNYASSSYGGFYIGSGYTYGWTTEIDILIAENNSARTNWGGGGVGSVTMRNSRIANNYTVLTANGSGAGLAVGGGSGSTVTIEDTVIEGNRTNSNTGGLGFWPTSAATLNLTRVTIANNTAGGRGGGMWVYGANCTINLTDCVISGNTAREYGGGIAFYNNGRAYKNNTLNIENTRIENNYSRAGQGGGIFVGYDDYGDGTDNRNTVNLLAGAVISGNTAGDANGTSNESLGLGGGIFCSRSNLNIFDGAEISGNTAAKYGGGVYTTSSTKLTMTGGTIIGNTASAAYSSYGGGGVAIRGGSETAQNGVYTFSGGTITGNTAYNGGGLLAGHWHDGVLVNGTLITDNTARQYGGGVYIEYANRLFTLERMGQIYDNTASLGQDVYHAYNSGYASRLELIAAQDMFDDGDNKLGVGWLDEVRDTVIETAIHGKLVRVYALTLDYTKRSVVAMIGEKEFSTVQAAVDYIYDHQELQGETIRMVDDSRENVVVPVGLKTTLNLNGHLLQGNTTAITVYGDVTIVDDKAEDDALSGEGVGTITGQGVEVGGGIHILAGGTATFMGGQITGCTAGVSYNANNYGGAAVCADSGTFVMSGGTITGNTCRYGAAVLLRNGASTFIMTGGTITGNNSTTSGAIYNRNGVVNISGGSITNNTATYGGAIFLYGGKTDIGSTGGSELVISGNTATNQGGAIYAQGASLTLSNVSILNNSTTNSRTTDVTRSAGGALYQNAGTTYINSGTVITGNRAVRGGGIYLYQGAVNMMGGLITRNVAQMGGGVAQYPATGNSSWNGSYFSVFNLSQGGIYNNRSSLYSAGNDIYSHYEGTGVYNAKFPPIVNLIRASDMQNGRYNVWKDDDYHGTERESDQISYGQYVTGAINSAHNVQLTADYYDTESVENIDTHFAVESVQVFNDTRQDRIGMVDGTGNFDTRSRSAEIMAKDADGAVESDETYLFNGVEYHYIELGGKLYEQDQMVEWAAGDDSSATNNLVRSYDTVLYTLTSNVKRTIESPASGDAEEQQETVQLWMEVTLPVGVDQAEFVTTGTTLKMKNYSIVRYTDRQVLTGYYEETVSAGTVLMESVQIKVSGMTNGETFKPTFKQWIGGNEENRDNPAECASKIVTVSAAGRYNVSLLNNSSLAYTGYFNLKTGLEASAEEAEEYPGDVVYGTMLGYGLSVQLYNESGKGLKGLEIPADGLSFDLHLRGDIFLDGEKIPDEDGVVHAPYIWAYKENELGNNGRPLGGTSNSFNMDWNDEDDLVKGTPYAYDAAPFNAGGGESACFSGGGWTISGSQPEVGANETVIKVTVNGYAFSMSDSNPKRNSDGTLSSILNVDYVKAFTAGYVQVLLPISEEITSSKNGYLAVFMEGAVSDLAVKSVSGMDPVDAGKDKDALEDYFGDETDERAVNEIRYVDNYNARQTGLYIYHGEGNSDTLTHNNYYTGTDLRGDTQNGTGTTPISSDVYISSDVTFYSKSYPTDDKDNFPDQYIPDEEFNPQTDNKVEYNYMTALDHLQKFDGVAYVPAGTGAIINQRYDMSSQTNNIGGGAFNIVVRESATTWSDKAPYRTMSYTLSILYAAKPDGTNWEYADIGDGKNDGGVADMDKYQAENLLYFTTLDELHEHFGGGGICVAILYQFRDCCVRTGRSLRISSYMHVTDDFEMTGGTYCTTNDDRCTSTYRPKYKNALSEGTLSDLLYDFDWTETHNDEYGTLGAALPSGGNANSIEGYMPDMSRVSAHTWIYSKNYIKTQYEKGSQVRGTHNGWLRGNTLLLHTLDSAVTITNTETLSNGTRKIYYNLSEGERIANFRVDPTLALSSAVRNNQLEDVTDGTQATNVTIQVTIPKGLTYREGSIAFDYSDRDPRHPKDKYLEGDLNWTINVEVNEETGETILTLVTQVSDIEKELPRITYSTKIGNEMNNSLDVRHGESLTTGVHIWAEYEEHNQLASEAHWDSVTISVLKDLTVSIYKEAERILQEVGGDLIFHLNYANMHSSQLSNAVELVDVLPYNGDPRGTAFHGGYRVSRIDVTFVGDGTNAEQVGADYNRFVSEGAVVKIGSGMTVERDGMVSQTVVSDLAENGTLLTGANSGVNTYSYVLTDAMLVSSDDNMGKALYIKLPAMEASTGAIVTVTMTPLTSDSQEGSSTLIEDSKGKTQTGSDIYYNSFMSNTQPEPIDSGAVYIQIVKRSISGLVWMDMDHNGVATNAEADTPMAGVKVTLLQESGEEWIAAKDVLGNELPAAITGTDGRYSFDNIGAGKYRVAFADSDSGYSMGGANTQAFASVQSLAAETQGTGGAGTRPLPFAQLSATTLQHSSNAGNRATGVYTGTDSDLGPAPLDSAEIKTDITLPPLEGVKTGHYISANWNAGFYYVNQTIEKDWLNMPERVKEGTEVTFKVTGTLYNNAETYHAQYVLTQGEAVSDVALTCTENGVNRTDLSVEQSFVYSASKSDLPVYIWRVANIPLQAEGSEGVISYTFEETAELSDYTTTLVNPYIDSSGATVFKAENTRLLNLFELVKIASEDVDKAKNGEDYNPLAGAQFSLSRDEEGADLIYFVRISAGRYHIAYDGVDVTKTTTLEVGEDGVLSLEDLPRGTYYLRETKAPAGRILPGGSWTVTIGADNELSVTANGTRQLAFVDVGRKVSYAGNEEIDSYLLPNAKLFDVPFTGATGVQVFMLTGMLLMSGGAALLFVYGKRKRRA